MKQAWRGVEEAGNSLLGEEVRDERLRCWREGERCLLNVAKRAVFGQMPVGTLVAAGRGKCPARPFLPPLAEQTPPTSLGEVTPAHR